MKLATFLLDGKETYGAVTDDGVVDLGARLGKEAADLKALIGGGHLGKAADAVKGAKADASVDAITFLPVIPNPDKLVCVGLNYKTHIAETGRSDSPYPVLFARWADAQVGHGQPMLLPKNSDKFDYEGELAVIIGTPARHVSKATALEHVAGYSIYNDGSIRDFQRHTHQFHPGKNFPGTGGFGPWMVTADEIPDPTTMRLITRLNGEVMQDSTTDLMVFDVPTLIEYISSFTQLNPGDVIVSGTPGGVGFARKPPVFMKVGDTIEVEIDRIGTLVNPIQAEV